MIKGLIAFALATGCAQHKLHWETYETGAGTIKMSQAPSFPSYCFDGLMRKWIEAGCNSVSYENLSEGYINMWCSEWKAESFPESSHALRANDYWLILWSEAAHQYARAAPSDTTYECGDASALLISAERD